MTSVWRMYCKGTMLICACVSCRLKKDDESLTIHNVNEGDEGSYTCTVKSEIDQDSASARLTVLGTLSMQTSAGRLRHKHLIETFNFQLKCSEKCLFLISFHVSFSPTT